MSDYEQPLLDRRPSRLRLPVMIIAPVLAILFQIYVPRFFPYLKYLEVPLLVTVYISLMRRQQVSGMLFGMSVGLLQDSLSNQPIGMFGIVKTLVGYLAASVSLRFDGVNPVIRFALVFLFFWFHQFAFWVLSRALLGEQFFVLKVEETLILGLLNALVSLPLYSLLDTLKE